MGITLLFVCTNSTSLKLLPQCTASTTSCKLSPGEIGTGGKANVSIAAHGSAGLSLPGAPRHSAINSSRAISCHRAPGARLGRGHLPAAPGNLSLGNARPPTQRRHSRAERTRQEGAGQPASSPASGPRTLSSHSRPLLEAPPVRHPPPAPQPRPLAPSPPRTALRRHSAEGAARPAPLSARTPPHGPRPHSPPPPAPAPLPGPGCRGRAEGGEGGCSSIAMATVTSSHPGSNWRKPRGPSRSPRANRACALPALAPAAARRPRIGCAGAEGRGRARRRGRDWPRGRGLSSG